MRVVHLPELLLDLGHLLDLVFGQGITGKEVRQLAPGNAPGALLHAAHEVEHFLEPVRAQPVERLDDLPFGIGCRRHGAHLPQRRSSAVYLPAPHRRRTTMRMSPRGRSVTLGSGATRCPGTSSKRTRWASVASSRWPSIRAKWLPMQMRGPAPKGR